LITFDFEKEAQEAEILFSKIHLLSLKEQAEYADPTFTKYVPSKEFCNNLSFDLYKMPYTFWTANMVGNIAYLAIHAPVPRQRFEETLDSYKRWRLSHRKFKGPFVSEHKMRYSEILKFFWAFIVAVSKSI